MQRRPTLRNSTNRIQVWSVLAALLVLAATVAWHLRGNMQDARSLQGAIDSAAPAALPAQAPDLAILTQWHPFGMATPTETVKEEIVVAPSPLAIELRGVAAGTGEESGQAILVGPDGVEKPYAVGDNITEDATLHAVQPHRIIIKRGERFESVPLPEAPSTGGGAMPPVSTAYDNTATSPFESPAPEMSVAPEPAAENPETNE